jgi:hypothetical protein
VVWRAREAFSELKFKRWKNRGRGVWGGKRGEWEICYLNEISWPFIHSTGGFSCPLGFWLPGGFSSFPPLLLFSIFLFLLSSWPPVFFQFLTWTWLVIRIGVSSFFVQFSMMLPQLVVEIEMSARALSYLLESSDIF